MTKEAKYILICLLAIWITSKDLIKYFANVSLDCVLDPIYVSSPINSVLLTSTLEPLATCWTNGANGQCCCLLSYTTSCLGLPQHKELVISMVFLMPTMLELQHFWLPSLTYKTLEGLLLPPPPWRLLGKARWPNLECRTVNALVQSTLTIRDRS